MKLFLFKAGRFLILLGAIWGLEMAGRKRDHVFPTARSSAGGLCGICADKQHNERLQQSAWPRQEKAPFLHH